MLKNQKPKLSLTDISKLWVRLKISTLILGLVLFLMGLGLALFVLGIPATYITATTNLQYNTTQLLTIERQFYSFVPLFFVSIFLLIVALLIVGVLICVWVYRDANKRGMDGALWLIIVIFMHIIGLIIYLIVRKPETVPRTAVSITTAKYCIYCGNPLPDDAKFCSKCGKVQTP